jgi:hypothetical protein
LLKKIQTHFNLTNLKGMTMKNQMIALALSCLVSTTVLASGGHDHGSHHQPLNGGVVTNVKGLDYELVAQKNSLQLYIRDHGESIDISKAQAKVTLLSGADKQEVELKPNGKKLEAAGNFKVSAGTKAVAVVSNGSNKATARFVIK